MVHQQAVADRAREHADALSLDEFVDVLEAVGLHHDDGKADPRFQTVLGAEACSCAEQHGELLAKSGMQSPATVQRARTESGLPNSWRHEQLSVVLALPAMHELEEPQRSLALRLIGTSHGYGRPEFPHAAAQLLAHTANESTLQMAVRLFDQGEWDQLIEDTHRRWGVWGCAYLEAVLRAADGGISGEGS